MKPRNYEDYSIIQDVDKNVMIDLRIGFHVNI
jgi:hypothetical protein